MSKTYWFLSQHFLRPSYRPNVQIDDLKQLLHPGHFLTGVTFKSGQLSIKTYMKFWSVKGNDQRHVYVPNKAEGEITNLYHFLLAKLWNLGYRLSSIEKGVYSEVEIDGLVQDIVQVQSKRSCTYRFKLMSK